MKTGYELLLPSGLLDIFEVKKVEEYTDHIVISLDEQNIIPDGYQGERLLSKGFYPAIEIKDFPVRSKGLLLRIRRRRWHNQDTGLPVMRDWTLVAKGTHLTGELAAFLKGLPG